MTTLTVTIPDSELIALAKLIMQSVEPPAPTPVPVPTPTPTPTPPPVVGSLITDKLPHPMVALDRPAPNTFGIEPMNGLKLWRVTNAALGQACVPMYSTVQGWNADESLMIIYHTTPAHSGSAGHHLYHGQPPYTYIKELPFETLPINKGAIDVEQIYWHPTDPDIIRYNAVDWSIREFRISTGEDAVLKQWPQIGSYEYADSHGTPSWDDKFVIGLKQQSANVAMIFHHDTNEVFTQPLPTDWSGPDIAPSGKLAYWHGDVYDDKFQHVRRLSINPDQSEVEHADCGRYADGTDTYNTVSFDDFHGVTPAAPQQGSLVVHELATGNFKVIIGPSTGYPYPPSGTHVSSKSYKAPGWVVLASTGNPAGQNLLDNEIYLVNTNPGHETTVYRIAHSRTFAQNSTHGSLAYWAEAHASLSPTATRIMFGSDWGDSGQVDTYVIELPS